MNQPSSEFIQLFLQYKKLNDELRSLKVANLMKRGYSKERAEDTVEKIDKAQFASHGLERSKETQQKQAEIMRFFYEHNDFIDDEQKWRNAARSRGVSMSNLMKYNSPLETNKQRKINLIGELNILPPMGTYPGGQNYRSAKNRYNKSAGRRTRKQRR